MNSDYLDNQPVSYCGGKECYGSKGKALAAKSRQISRAKSRRNSHKEQKRRISPIEPYRCANCGQWHLGARHNRSIRND